MMLRDVPCFTDIYESVTSFQPVHNSAYVYAISDEERSQPPYDWMRQFSGVELFRIVSQEPERISLERNGLIEQILLRSRLQLSTLSQNGDNRIAYIDITGLSHHVWAPILRAFLDSRYTVKVIYVEPRSYKLITSSTEGDFYDLSESTRGISPIPGFASLSRSRGNDVSFVPLIGFEGARLIRVIEEVDAPEDRVFPIIGVPGFLPEYPFRTYQGNKFALNKHHAWKAVRFATANCPFSIFYTLEAIAQLHPSDVIKIAPIGTKPHALGAILFALLSPYITELVYDHPVRKTGRTEGASRLLVYHVSTLKRSGLSYA
ncbi:MAG: hypothetical protein ACRYFS_12775 [Janthinobacterium lividum]